jgi:K+-sensing histidine kinase KdpD
VLQPSISGDELSISALVGSVAEDLKLPLMQIARKVELGYLEGKSAEETLSDLDGIASDALKLMDSYSLGLELGERQQLLELEPLSIQAVLYDTAQEMDSMAKRYGVELELNTTGARHQLIMANKTGLRAALLSLGSVFIESTATTSPRPTITLAAYKTAQGIASGIYSQTADISPGALALACRLSGRARQPLSNYSTGSAMGIYVANNILQAMSAKLRTSRFRHQGGLGMVLLPSRQLQLV